MLYAFGTTNSIKLKGCNSNKINQISGSDSTKSTIRFDEEHNIILNRPNSNVKIWCDSDVLIDKCSLEHLTSNVKCETAVPLPCNNGEICQNNDRINLNYTSRRRCEFNFERVEDAGNTICINLL